MRKRKSLANRLTSCTLISCISYMMLMVQAPCHADVVKTKNPKIWNTKPEFPNYQGTQSNEQLYVTPYGQFPYYTPPFLPQMANQNNLNKNNITSFSKIEKVLDNPEGYSYNYTLKNIETDSTGLYPKNYKPENTFFFQEKQQQQGLNGIIITPGLIMQFAMEYCPFAAITSLMNLPAIYNAMMPSWMKNRVIPLPSVFSDRITEATRHWIAGQTIILPFAENYIDPIDQNQISPVAVPGAAPLPSPQPKEEKKFPCEEMECSAGGLVKGVQNVSAIQNTNELGNEESFINTGYTVLINNSDVTKPFLFATGDRSLDNESETSQLLNNFFTTGSTYGNHNAVTKYLYFRENPQGLDTEKAWSVYQITYEYNEFGFPVMYGRTIAKNICDNMTLSPVSYTNAVKCQFATSGSSETATPLNIYWDKTYTAGMWKATITNVTSENIKLTYDFPVQDVEKHIVGCWWGSPRMNAEGHVGDKLGLVSFLGEKELTEVVIPAGQTVNLVWSLSDLPYQYSGPIDNTLYVHFNTMNSDGSINKTIGTLNLNVKSDCRWADFGSADAIWVKGSGSYDAIIDPAKMDMEETHFTEDGQLKSYIGQNGATKICSPYNISDKYEITIG